MWYFSRLCKMHIISYPTFRWRMNSMNSQKPAEKEGHIYWLSIGTLYHRVTLSDDRSQGGNSTDSQQTIQQIYYGIFTITGSFSLL